MLSSRDRDVAERSDLPGQEKGDREDTGERRAVCLSIVERATSRRLLLHLSLDSSRPLSPANPHVADQAGRRTKESVKKGKGGPAMSIPKKAAKGNDVKEASKEPAKQKAQRHGTQSHHHQEDDRS